MGFIDFQNSPLWVPLLVFAISAAAVWSSGARLSEYMEAIAEKTGLGYGFVGMLILGGITSLPEVATVSTASLTGNAPLAVNTMLGSISVNFLFLAIADFVIGRDALTSVVAHSSTLLQGTLNVLMLTVVVAAGVVAAPVIWHTSSWSWVIAGLFVLAMVLAAGHKRRNPWVARDEASLRDGRGEGDHDAESDDEDRSSLEEKSLKQLIVRTVIAGLVILVAGYFLARSGDAIATKTGLGSSLVGLVLLGVASGLPEISTTTAAVRLGRYEMAVGDIFGTNLWNVLIIAVADLLYTSGSALEAIGQFELVATLLAIVLTSVYLLGLLERRDRTLLRMGYDSVAVIVLYFGGVGLLYWISTGGTR